MQLGLAMQALAERFPTAELKTLYTSPHNAFGSVADLTVIPFSQAVVIEGNPVSIVSNRYKLIQHYDAFQPILQGLETAGIKNIEVNMGARGAHAWMDVLVDDDVVDSVRIGYRVQNSHDGKHALSYSFGAEKVEKFVEQVDKKASYEQGLGHQAPKDVPKGGYRYFEIVGYRQVCANGQKIRVPIAEAEAGEKGVGLDKYSIGALVTDIWKEDELRERAVILAQSFTRIMHMGKPEQKIEAQKQAAELIALFRDPVKRLVERARAKHLTQSELREVFDSRFSDKASIAMMNVLECKRDEATAWDAYQAMTNYGTHLASEKFVNTAFDKAADYLVTLVTKHPEAKEAKV